jgi:prefoldin subunit 5
LLRLGCNSAGDDEAAALEGALGELEAQQAELHSLRHTVQELRGKGQSSEAQEKLDAALQRCAEAEAQVSQSATGDMTYFSNFLFPIIYEQNSC